MYKCVFGALEKKNELKTILSYCWQKSSNTFSKSQATQKRINSLKSEM